MGCFMDVKGTEFPESELQRSRGRGRGEENHLGGSCVAAPGAGDSWEGVWLSPSLAGDPDIAGGYELCSWRASLLGALDSAACLRLCVLGRVCGE